MQSPKQDEEAHECEFLFCVVCVLDRLATTDQPSSELCRIFKVFNLVKPKINLKTPVGVAGEDEEKIRDFVACDNLKGRV